MKILESNSTLSFSKKQQKPTSLSTKPSTKDTKNENVRIKLNTFFFEKPTQTHFIISKIHHKRPKKFSPWKLTVEGSPSIFEIISIRSTVHLAVEFSVDDWTIGILIQWVRFVLDPSSGEQCTSALVGLEHGLPSMVLVVMVVF